jgi:hypothetical protein
MADQNVTQKSTTSTIPDWAQSYFTGEKGIFPQAQALAQQPYQTYGGQRTADFSGLTQQAMQGAGAMTPSTLTTLGGGIAGAASMNAGNVNYQGYQPGQFTGQAASQYMNPFMQNVVDIQQREAQRRADIAGTGRNAQAVKAGAFGGSRQGIMDAEAARNLAIQQGDIQAQGLNQAFNQAQGQFNTEQQLAEQSRQYGAGLGLQGLQTAIQGAGQLGTLGQQGFTQDMDINKLQAQYGSQQQAMEQGKLDQQYQDFLTQQQYPYQQLGFYTDILGSGLRGASGVTSQASNMYAPPPSTTSQLLGLGTAALGAYGAFGKAEGGTVGYAGGGSIGGYAVGGIAGLNPMELDAATDKMSDPQMQGVMGLASVADLAKLQIAQKLAQNTQIRQAAQQAQAAQQQQPQGSIAEEALAELGVGGLDVPDEMFSGAEGGIVAFANTGSVPGPKDVKERWQDMKRRPDETPTDFVRRVEAAKQKDFQAQGPAKLKEPLEEALKENKRNMEEGMRAALAKLRKNEPLISELGVRPGGMELEAPVAEGEPVQRQNPLRAQEAEANIAYGPEAAPEAAPEAEPEAAPVTPAWGAGDQATPTTPVASGIATLPSGMNKTMEQLIAMRQRSPEEQAALTKYEGEQKAIFQRRIDEEKKNAQQVKLDRKELGERGVEREKYIKGEEAKLSGAEEKSVNMALIEAGLAIMSGTSANPFENLGRGVVGVKAYKEDMAKLQTRKDKLRDEMFNLEESRYGDKKLSKAEDRENQKKVSEAESNMDKALSEIGRNNNVVFPEAVRKEAIATFMAQETARYGAETNMAVAQFKANADRETAKITANKSPELIILAKELYEDARARGEPMTRTQAMEKAAEVKGTSAYNVAALKGDNDKQVALTKSLAAIDESFNLLIAVAKDGPEKQALITERDNRKQAAIRDSGVSGGAGTRPPDAVRLKPQQ